MNKQKIEFSEAAQGLARAILKRTHATPEAVITSFDHFVASDDISGAFLVMKAWKRVPGFNLTEVVRFARAERDNYASTLDWMRRSLLGPAPAISYAVSRRCEEAAATWVKTALTAPEA